MSRWRAASLIAVHVLIGVHLAHWMIAGRTLAPLEPSEMFDTLHLGIVTIGFLFMVVLVLATALVGRFFCSWGCHILALQDLCAWILGRLGIRPRPLRSRVLIWVPPLAVVYLFAWPPLQRWLKGSGNPSLRVIDDPEGWSSFTTTDLLRSFPGPFMIVVTLAICGFAIVYFLGSRSFCSYACPYGALFAGADRLAPLRIIAGTGACSKCGLCVSSCRSNVRVIEEVNRFGTVMNSSCMRDLDCVTVCPTGALKYGWTVPPLFRSWRRPRSLAKQYDFTRWEDVVIGIVFIAAFLTLRGLYDGISFLLALALAAMSGFFAVLCWRLLRASDVRLRNRSLKSAGRLLPAGRLWLGALCLLGLLLAHSGWIRYHRVAGQVALGQVSLDPGELAARSGVPADESAHATGALYHLQLVYDWGLYRSDVLLRELAYVHQLTGSPAAARTQLYALLRRDPLDLASRLRLGGLLLQEGSLELAGRHLERLVEQIGTSVSRAEKRILASAHRLLGDVAVRRGEPEEAIRQFELSRSCDGEVADVHLALGAMLTAAGRLKEAEACFRAGLALQPQSAAAHNNLAAVLVQMERGEEAIDHYRASLALFPENPLGHSNLGMLLLARGELGPAENSFRAALRLDPADRGARSGLQRVAALREDRGAGIVVGPAAE